MNRLKDQAQTSSNAERYMGGATFITRSEVTRRLGSCGRLSWCSAHCFEWLIPPHNRDLLQIELLKRLIMRIHV